MADRYQIRGKLGRGGIGAVYRGFDTQLEREVAIKRLLPLEETHLNELDHGSLMREAAALARFQHPNIVTIFAFEEDEEGPFVVTELINGENLKATVEKGALAADDFQEFVTQILDALIAAQQMDLLHRDIKPANLMLSFLPSGKFQVKILDFGLAKFSETPSAQTLDQTGSFLGSIDFIAPEQIDRQPLDQRTDLYSLGCVCYFALTQKPPFEGENMAKTMSNHLKHRVTSIFEYRPDLPPAIGAWVMRMIAAKPSHRPLNATEASKEFEQAKDGIAPQMPDEAIIGTESEDSIEVTPAPSIGSDLTESLQTETGSQPLPGRRRTILTGASAPIKTTTSDPGHLKRPTSTVPARNQGSAPQISRPVKQGLPVGAIAGLAATSVLILVAILFFIFKGDEPDPPIAKVPDRRENSPKGGSNNKGTKGNQNLPVAATSDRPVFSPSKATGKKPVQVYILLGTENMTGLGQITGEGSRWGDEFIDPVLSIYIEPYRAGVDFDKLEPTRTLKLSSFGGVKPTPFPAGGGTYVVRGQIAVKDTGAYQFRPGWARSTENIMEVDGKEVHRNEPNKEQTFTPISLKQGTKVPFKITYLSDTADGLGWSARTDVPGCLSFLVNEGKQFSSLVDGSGNWVTRKDVWYQGLGSAKGSQWLSAGCGSQKSYIGPELGFGQVVGDHHEDPVLIIKFALQGRILGRDFLPPGSTTGDPKDKSMAGKAYEEAFRSIVKSLENFDRSFPAIAGSGYEIAGFVWWQGHSDGKPPYADRYEQNLVNLIKAFRKDFKAPDVPFVVGTVGVDGWKMKAPLTTIATAQLAVSGDKGKYPEFKDNVHTVETRGFWKPANLSPKTLPHNYNGNAETMMNVGQALGEAMVELVKKSGK